MKEEIYSKVIEYIEGFGKVVSEGAIYGFELLVKQQIVNGIVNIVTLLLSLVVLTLVIKYTSKLTKSKREEVNYKKESDRWYTTSLEEDFLLGLPVIFGVVATVLLIVSVFVIPSSIAQIINPEYYAIKEIMNTLGGSN
jgi:Ca2+/Na+ antiporter